MTSHWFSIVAFIAALLIGYAFVNRGGDNDFVDNVPVGRLEDYYLQNAEIVETDDSGKQRLRYLAAEATRNARDDAIQMKMVRIDYAIRGNDSRHDNSATRWVLTADTGVQLREQDPITLEGDVTARSTGARNVSLSTESLEVDVEKQTATSVGPVAIDIDGQTVAGRGLSVDLPRERFQLRNGGNLRLAQLSPTAGTGRTTLSVPNIFTYDRLDFDDNVLSLQNVRSEVPPFVTADRAVASGTDIENNQFSLRGHVRFDLPQEGKLSSDSAIVTIRNGRIVQAAVSGRSNDEPVEFEHSTPGSADSGASVWRGHAQKVDYDVDANTLLLQGDVWLSRSFKNTPIEITCPIAKYNLLDGSGSCISNDQVRPRLHSGDGETPTP